MTDIWGPPGLREIIESANFVWPGWRISMGRDNEGLKGWTLHIVSHTVDSWHPEKMISVDHSFPIPNATYNERTWRAWILERLMGVFRHEAGEGLEFNGVKVFAPHHGNGEDPYITWHNGDTLDTQVRAGETKP
jgi:hypothetical protein